MLWSREQLSPFLDTSKKLSGHPLLERGKKYLGRDVPAGYFTIQDWCVSQGIASEYSIPDLTLVLQGVEYILQAGIGKYPQALTPVELAKTMHYLNREEVFEGGALHQYPELPAMTKQELLKLPKGREVIRILGEIPEYHDLFSDRATELL